jgi:NAD(P)-dependent dehydrogenase (short-subunit alcohol dehydrogenase family)
MIALRVFRVRTKNRYGLGRPRSAERSSVSFVYIPGMTHAANTSQVWFITGASSGFGKALALELLQQGHQVVALARNTDALADVVAGAPDRVLPLGLDVTKATQIDDAVGKAYEHFGRIDVLVNNAGFSIIGAVEETDDATLRDTIETMFFGPARLTKAVLPKMRAAGRGTIVQMSSVGGFVTAPGFGAYCAAKHALEAYSEALSAEVAPHGIRVLIVEPGAFRTALFGSAFRSMPALPIYEATVGGTRKYVAESAGRQPGDPVKAARAIIATVKAETAPLRLPLGPDAVDGIRTKLDRVTTDVAQTEAVARAAVF